MKIILLDTSTNQQLAQGMAEDGEHLGQLNAEAQAYNVDWEWKAVEDLDETHDHFLAGTGRA